VAEQWVIVIPPSGNVPMEIVGIFPNREKAEVWAVGQQLIRWTMCPILSPKQGAALAIAGALARD